VRHVIEGNIEDEVISAWLVGQEDSNGGYKIVMRDDGLQFGLASNGFPSDKHPILCGWYGNLHSAFAAM